MIFTLYYAYATLIQWWRLRLLRNKLNGTLNSQNALLICTGDSINDWRKHRSLENLLFRNENRIGCTIVPKQKLNLSHWLAFPTNLRNFPIYFDESNRTIERNRQIYVLLQAILQKYVQKQKSDVIQVEQFGELVGWRVVDHFEIILRTDLNSLTKLVQQFRLNNIDINHDLQLLKIETVDVEGAATCIKYDKKYLKEQTLKYSYAPIHWNKFVQEIKDLYVKIRDITTPKIKIENGSTKSFDSTKSSVQKNKEIKKIDDKKHHHESKKEPKRHQLDDKNTLEVASKSSSDHRRHKHQQNVKTSERKSAKEAKATSSTLPKTGKVRKVSDEKLEKGKKLEKRGSGAKLVKQKSVIENESVATSPVKPPNILVYADSVRVQDNVKRVLFSILSKEKYTIYDLPTTKSTPWHTTTALIVVCGTVPPHLTHNLITYLLTSNGQLLCLCSDLMNSILHPFTTTAEVREHELVHFTYKRWQSVQMMHHIFCYQASPAKKQFSKDSDHSSGGSSPHASPHPSTAPLVALRHNERDYEVQVRVLGAEETWHTPSLLLAQVKNGGRAVFSQVHLEIEPEMYEHEEELCAKLKASNGARIEILRDVLEEQFELECDNDVVVVEYVCGFFLGRFDDKMEMIANCEAIKNNQLETEKVNVVFCRNQTEVGIINSIRLPVLIHSCPVNFSTIEYFDTLKTNSIGRLVIYSDILTSTHHLVSKRLRNGLVVIAKQQTNGVGRSNNAWISPLGSASFSLQLHIELDSNIGRVLPIMQHLIGVAIVQAIKNLYDKIEIGIKWPNDLYVNGSIKIGGIVVNSTIINRLAIVNIGCGFNLSNDKPTISLNGLVKEANCIELGYERYFAIVFNEIEKLVDLVQEKGVEILFELYYRHWLHSGASVTIETKAGGGKEATVVGIDEFGFLSVQFANGTKTSVQPDGNSFDMMRGLIAPKHF